MENEGIKLIKKIIEIIDANEPEKLKKIINLIENEKIDLSGIKTSNSVLYNVISNIIYVNYTSSVPFGLLATEEDKKENYIERLKLLKEKIDTYLNNITEYSDEAKILSIFRNNI